MIKEKVNKENRNERYFWVILLWKIISPFYVVFFTNSDKSSHAWLHMIVYLLSTLVRARYTDKGFELVCGCRNFITTRNEDMIGNKIFNFWLICNFISLWIFLNPFSHFHWFFFFLVVLLLKLSNTVRIKLINCIALLPQ